MVRLLGLLVLLGLACAAVLIVLGAAMRPSGSGREVSADPVPRAIRRLSYLALIIVSLGVTTGLLGGT